MKDAGSLILRSSQYYFVGITLLSIEVVLFGFGKGSGLTYIFLGGWIIGLLLFVYPSLMIHQYMKKQKENKIKEIGEKIRKTGKEPGGRLQIETKDEREMLNYIFLFLEHEHATQTSEYPFDAEIIREILLASFLPFITNILISVLL